MWGLLVEEWVSYYEQKGDIILTHLFLFKRSVIYKRLMSQVMHLNSDLSLVQSGLTMAHLYGSDRF